VNPLLVFAMLQQGSLDPDLASLVARVPEPRIGAPSVFNVISDNRVVAGDQLNVLTAAWLPRSLRLRLRQPPSLTPPVIKGVWATPRSPVSGAVATREGEDESYDLFVVAQTVYPLDPGTITIPPARLAWVEPARGRREERHAVVSSATMTVQVRPLPATGQPPQFPGTVGHDLSIEYRVTGSGRAGAVVPVEIAVLGTGGLPLWPAPTIAWPQGARAYDQGSDASFGPRGARLGGTRVFRYSVVPESAGGLSLPPHEYPYFDPGTSAYRVARAPGTIVPILEPAPAAERRVAVSLLQPGSLPIATRVASLPGYVLWLLLGFPVLVIAAIELWRRYPKKPPVTQPVAAPEQLDLLVRSVLPPNQGPSRQAITAALRRAGVPSERADRLAELHLGMEELRFGVTPPPSPPEQITRAIEHELSAIPKKVRKLAGIAAMVMLSLVARLDAQGGYELYNKAQYLAAADAFRLEAREFPGPERWYNVAAAEYMSGRDAYAAAALLTVRTEDPRDPRVRALWNALAREHGELRRVPRGWILTADECVALALAASWLGVIFYLAFRRWRPLWLAALGLAVAGLIASGVQHRAQRERRAVLAGGASQRVSPHGLAPTTGAIPAFTVVKLIRKNGNWWLIESDGGVGWVPSEILVEAPLL
jgi:hypothetical protein